MEFVHIIRHARPAAVWGGSDDDPGLDETGLKQARSAAQVLMELPADRRPRRVASSPLRRCRETAAPFAAALSVEVEIVPEVGEIPTPKGLAASERGLWLRTAFAGRWADIRGDLDYAAWRSAVVAAVAARPGHAIFSHFVAINAVVSSLAGNDDVAAFRPDHVSISTLSLNGGRLALVEPGAEAATSVL